MNKLDLFEVYKQNIIKEMTSKAKYSICKVCGKPTIGYKKKVTVHPQCRKEYYK